MPGEAGSIFLKEEKVGPVELATISFGQRFEITPIQMLTVVSTIANNGKKFTPRLVKATIDSKTGERHDIEMVKGEKVISETTAKKVLSMMESVVAEGTGRNAQVKGYSIGGKTGTSEDGVNTNKYVTSFVGVADISDPEVAIIIVLYNPTGEGGHQGGAVAAPIASQVLRRGPSVFRDKETRRIKRDNRKYRNAKCNRIRIRGGQKGLKRIRIRNRDKWRGRKGYRSIT